MKEHEYFQKKLISSLKIPKSYLFEPQLGINLQILIPTKFKLLKNKKK